MRTLNVKQQTKKFFDKETGKYIGFAGYVDLYDKKIFVNTKNGIGYDLVIKELASYISYLSLKYNLSNIGFLNEDIKQHIIMCILEGIPRFDPDKNTKLSSFLYFAVERRIINEVKNVGVESNNPTILSTSLYSITCNCGRKFTLSLSSDEKVESEKCDACQKSLKNVKAFLINSPPSQIGASVDRLTKNSQDVCSWEDIVSDNSFDIPTIYGEKTNFDDDIALEYDLKKCMELEDDSIKELVYLICFKDHSITSAAKKIGMSQTVASYKLKTLKRKKKIRNMLCR